MKARVELEHLSSTSESLEFGGDDGEWEAESMILYISRRKCVRGGVRVFLFGLVLESGGWSWAESVWVQLHFCFFG